MSIAYVKLSAAVAFRLEERAPEVAAQLIKQHPLLAAQLARLNEGYPVPPTCKPFVVRAEQDGWVRPGSHSRAFYYSTDPIVDLEQDPNLHPNAQGRGALAFKGFEPHAADIWPAMQNVAQIITRYQRVADHFALFERKVLLGVSLKEASGECERALELQRAHLAVYGELAHLPVPIAVLRWDDDLSQKHGNRLRKLVSERAFECVESVLEDGLGAYVYSYPVVPVRVAHFVEASALKHGCALSPRAHLTDARFPPQPRLARFDLIRAACDPFAVIDGWLKTFVRLFCLGYMPAGTTSRGPSGSSRGLGQTCNPLNSPMDGGFNDIDSIVPLASFEDPRMFHLCMEFSFKVLFGTIRLLLVGVENVPAESSLDEIYYFGIERYLWRRIGALLESEQRSNAKIDARVLEYLDPTPRTIARLFSLSEPPGQDGFFGSLDMSRSVRG